jgi:hypothetical protein
MTDQPADTAPPAAEVDSRLDRVEAAIEAIKNMLTGAHKDATATTQQRLDAPGSIADEVQRELARRDEAARKEEEQRELGTLKETVRGLTEKTPAPPPRRVERIMGWHG